jgi:hypothetical protein
LPEELLKLYGVPEREFKQAMQKLGFDARHRQYNDIYYQALPIAYLIGIDKDDPLVRKAVWFLMAIRIWNGRNMQRFPKNCDPDIARYVMNYEL